MVGVFEYDADKMGNSKNVGVEIEDQKVTIVYYITLSFLLLGCQYFIQTNICIL
jgi:hypothetical protein